MHRVFQLDSHATRNARDTAERQAASRAAQMLRLGLSDPMLRASHPPEVAGQLCWLAIPTPSPDRGCEPTILDAVTGPLLNVSFFFSGVFVYVVGEQERTTTTIESDDQKFFIWSIECKKTFNLESVPFLSKLLSKNLQGFSGRFLLLDNERTNNICCKFERKWNKN